MFSDSIANSHTDEGAFVMMNTHYILYKIKFGSQL
jgi:hypothetical protein